MKVKILSLKPTQFCLGYVDVDDKILKVRAARHGVPEKKVPVVKGPKGQLYIIDHHHYVRAMWENQQYEVLIQVVADYSKLSRKKFWAKMIKMKYVFLFDQFGAGPHRPEYLPRTIRSMADNPYRSLAWMIREAGHFDKSPVPFAEFYWGEFFRENLGKLDPLSNKGIKAATKLAKSKKAKVANLPGVKCEAI